MEQPTAVAPQYYLLPAEQNDFPDDPVREAEMRQRWNWVINAFTLQAITGDPWTSVHDSPRSNYYNPLAVTPQSSVVQPITWTAFPNRIRWYFNVSQGNPYQVDERLLYPLADLGILDPTDPVLMDYVQANNLEQSLKDLLQAHPGFGRPNPEVTGFCHVSVPSGLSAICPTVDWSGDPKDWSQFGPPGPRGWKDEYNEWVVTRDEQGRITRISFTCENPEYWFTLWSVDPDKVLQLYRELVNPAVQMADLQLTDSQGQPVLDYEGKPFYNPLNKWNAGNVALPDRGGAMHLTSPPNTVGAEIYLGAAATIPRDVDPYSPQAMNCCSGYGQSFRNSDPNIGFQVNQIVRNLGFPATLTNPVSLYMQTPDFSNYVTPDGTDAASFFTINRGRNEQAAGVRYDQILHATFEVPAELGYTVSDIKIAGSPICWGSQVAETFNMALAGTADTASKADQTQQACPQDAASPNPWPQLLISNAVLSAFYADQAIANAPLPPIAPVVSPGQSLTGMALLVVQGMKGASISFPGEDISVTVTGQRPGPGSVPGQTGISSTFIYVLDIQVGADVTPGQKSLQVVNPGAPLGPPIPGFLTVTA